MYEVLYINQVTFCKEYRRYKNMDMEHARKIAISYSKRHKLQLISITKVY